MPSIIRGNVALAVLEKGKANPPAPRKVEIQCAHRKAGFWDEARRQILLDHYETEMPIEQIARLAGTSAEAVKVQANHMQLYRRSRVRHSKLARFWAKDEIEIVVAHYPTRGPSGCAELLNDRSPQSIRYKARELGVRGPGPGRKFNIGEASGAHTNDKA